MTIKNGWFVVSELDLDTIRAAYRYGHAALIINKLADEVEWLRKMVGQLRDEIITGTQSHSKCGRSGVAFENWLESFQLTDKRLREIEAAAEAVCEEYDDPDPDPPSETYFHDLVVRLNHALAPPAAASEACDGSRFCKATTHLHGCFSERPAAASEEGQR